MLAVMSVKSGLRSYGGLQMDIGYVNNPYVIARNPKVVAINSAVQMDRKHSIAF